VTTSSRTRSTALKLAGVRAKPGVVAKAKNLDDLNKIPQQQLMAIAQSMASHGFFIYREGKGYAIVSNEGEMQISCDDGVVYTLRFGEVLIGSGEEISAGGKEEPKKDKKD
jgi:hypothetical protein